MKLDAHTKVGLIRELREVERAITGATAQSTTDNLLAYRTALREELHKRNYRP